MKIQIMSTALVSLLFLNSHSGWADDTKNPFKKTSGNTVRTKLSEVEDKLKSAGGEISSKARSLKDKIKDKVSDVKDKAKDKISDAKNSVQDKINSAKDKLTHKKDEIKAYTIQLAAEKERLTEFRDRIREEAENFVKDAGVVSIKKDGELRAAMLFDVDGVAFYIDFELMEIHRFDVKNNFDEIIVTQDDPSMDSIAVLQEVVDLVESYKSTKVSEVRERTLQLVSDLSDAFLNDTKRAGLEKTDRQANTRGQATTTQPKTGRVPTGPSHNKP